MTAGGGINPTTAIHTVNHGTDNIGRKTLLNPAQFVPWVRTSCLRTQQTGGQGQALSCRESPSHRFAYTWMYSYIDGLSPDFFSILVVVRVAHGAARDSHHANARSVPAERGGTAARRENEAGREIQGRNGVRKIQTERQRDERDASGETNT